MARARKGTRRQTYVALLRAINLGSHNKIAMPALKAVFESLGAEGVNTYVQSGNVVFRRSGGASTVQRDIERAIASEFGLTITVLLRTKAQLAKLVRDNPFGQSPEKALHVTFLADTPAKARVRELDPTAFEPDTFQIAGREIYLNFPNGYGRSKLSNAYFEKQLEVAATTRNWKTVNALAELAAT
jgi:uncharacterized protein (DUF1697 family)